MPWGVYEVEGPDGNVIKVRAKSEADAPREAKRQYDAIGQLPPVPDRERMQPSVAAPPATQPTQDPPSMVPDPGEPTRIMDDFHPLAKLGLEVAGGFTFGGAIPSLAKAAPGLARFAGRAPNVVQNFARGATEGAVAGGIIDGPDKAKTDAVIGGTLSAAAGPAGGAYRGGKKLIDYFRSPGTRANRVAHELVESGPVPPASGVLPEGAVVADYVDPSAIRKIANKAPAEAREDLAGALTKRQDEVPDRLAAQFRETFPDTPSLADITEAGAKRAERAKELYAEAENVVMPRAAKDAIRNFMERPTFGAAERDAYRRLVDDIGIDNAQANTIGKGDAILKALDAKLEAAKKVKDKHMVGIIQRLKEPLSNALEKNPAYKKARDFARTTANLDDALQEGRHVLDSAAPDGSHISAAATRAKVAAMPPDQQRYFRAGVVDSLFRGASQQDQAANIVTLFSNRGTKAQLKAILPESTFDDLQKYVAGEGKKWRTFVAGTGGAGESLPKDLNEALGVAGNLIRTFIWYSPFAFNSMAQSVMKRVVGATDDDMYRQLAQTLRGTELPTPPRVPGAINPAGIGTATAFATQNQSPEAR